MRKVAVSFIIVMMVLVGCQSAETERANDGGFLWQVENGDTTVYLQGTIHLGTEDFYPLNEQIENAYEASDVVMPEINLNEIDEAALLPMTFELALYEEDETIQDHLSEEALESLEEILEDNMMSMELVQHFKPWFLEMMLLQFSIEDTDYSAEYAVDQYFLDRAAEDGKEIQELESYEDQISMLAGFSDELQLEMLENAILSYESSGESVDELVDFWRYGKVEELSGVTDEGETIDGYDEYLEEINANRNRDMANQIVDILEEDNGQTYFVFVGALHMVEEPSIVSLIEEEGFDVEHVY